MTTKHFYEIMVVSIGKKILDFTDEEELYNAIISAKQINSKNDIPKYIKQSFINMCILLRQHNGLSNTYLVGKKREKKTKEL